MKKNVDPPLLTKKLWRTLTVQTNPELPKFVHIRASDTLNLVFKRSL
jgi:hypothetical protein